MRTKKVDWLEEPDDFDSMDFDIRGRSLMMLTEWEEYDVYHPEGIDEDDDPDLEWSGV